MKISVLIFLFCSGSIGLTAQTGIIEGKVVDRKNGVVAGATVSLLQASDSSVLKHTVSAGNGKFVFEGLSPADYLVKITAVSFQPYVSVPLGIDEKVHRIILPVIVLYDGKHRELQAVEVHAKKPLLEQQLDKTVVNVQSMITASTSNTLEVLERVPGVTVDRNGEISLNGRGGVMVMIDGRSTYMSGPDLAAYLKSLPGGLLEKIELMDNPPAKYEASGNAIINIRLKKNREAGVTGSVSSAFSMGRYGRTNHSVNINYHRKKINVFTNAGFITEKSFNRDIYDRRLYTAQGALNSTIDLFNEQVYRIRGINANMGMDYSPSAKTTLGLSMNVHHGKRNGDFGYHSETFDYSGSKTASGVGNTFGRDERTHLGANVNMQHKFDDKRELTADVNYLNYRSDGTRRMVNTYYEGGVADSADEFLYVLPAEAEIYVAKADYVQTLKDKVKLEMGVRSGFIVNENVNDYYGIFGSNEIKDNGKSDHFRYRENVNAAYVSGQKNWNRFGMQMGLRAENTRADGKQYGNEAVTGSSFSRRYTDFFPSAYFSYKLDSAGSKSLTFSINRRINRPNYYMLNPFLFFRDQYNYRSGNPMLAPQFQYRYELKYQHKQWFWTALSYNRFTNVIFETTRAEGDQLFIRPENVARGFMIILNTGFNVKVANWWQVNSTVRLARLGLDGMAYTERLNPVANVIRLEVMNNFTVAKGLTAEAWGYFASRDINGQTLTGGMYRANVAVQKKIWKDKGSIKVGVDDIFYSWVYKNRSVSLKQTDYRQTVYSDTRRVSVGFSYRFGKEVFARKRRSGEVNDEEKGRLN